MAKKKQPDASEEADKIRDAWTARGDKDVKAFLDDCGVPAMTEAEQQFVNYARTCLASQSVNLTSLRHVMGVPSHTSVSLVCIALGAILLEGQAQMQAEQVIYLRGLNDEE